MSIYDLEKMKEIIDDFDFDHSIEEVISFFEEFGVKNNDNTDIGIITIKRDENGKIFNIELDENL